MRAFRVLFLVLAVAVPAAAQSLEDALRDFEAWATAEMERDSTPGLSVAVAKGEWTWAKGFGFADVENRVPATAESSYRMASVTKPMTAVAAMRLVEEGKLDLDAPIQTYVPYFPDKGATITMRQLLAHLGGISHYRDYRVEGRIRDPKTTREAIEIFAGFDLVAPPGSRYEYSTYGYNLAGAVLEGAAGKPYGTLMRELVWGPAGMAATRMDDPAEIIPNRVEGYRLVDGTLKNSEFVDISSRFAGGGTRSTVLDMIAFARALDRGTLLAPASLDAMWTPQVTSAGRLTGYGLGWSAHALNGRFQVNHSGAQQETRTFLMLIPGEDLAVAIASNFEDIDLGKYRNRLFWHLTGEAWTFDAYTPDRRDRLARELANATFNQGRFHFDRTGAPVTDDPKRVGTAFAALRGMAAAIADDPAAAEKAIRETMDVKGGEAYAIAGSWMAARLADRDAARYARLGSLAFLADWIALSRRDRSIPRAWRFPRAFEARVEQLAKEWEAVWTPEATAMLVAGAEGAEQFGAAVGPARRRILPSFARPIVAGIESSFTAGDVARAMRLGRVGVTLHPEDAETTGAQGVLLSLAGEAAAGRAMLAKSLALAARGYARAANLIEIARFVGERDAESAIALLENAAEVHPESAAVFVALGDARAARGETERARAAYERARSIDPDSAGARAGLARLGGS